MAASGLGDAGVRHDSTVGPLGGRPERLIRTCQFGEIAPSGSVALRCRPAFVEGWFLAAQGASGQCAAMGDDLASAPPGGRGRRLRRTVALVGLMGAGKTTVGRALARRLGVPFRDADAEIEKAADLTVTEIFQRLGEGEFRKGERRVIARLLEQPAFVLATGGGAYMNGETRALLAHSAISVWLRADLDLLMRRVPRRNTRPLLQQGDPRATMGRLMTERYPVYAQADLVVDIHDGAAADIARTIAALLPEKAFL